MTEEDSITRYDICSGRRSMKKPRRHHPSRPGVQTHFQHTKSTPVCAAFVTDCCRCYGSPAGGQSAGRNRQADVVPPRSDVIQALCSGRGASYMQLCLCDTEKLFAEILANEMFASLQEDNIR